MEKEELPEDAGTLPDIMKHRDDERIDKLVLEFQLGDGSYECHFHCR